MRTRAVRTTALLALPSLLLLACSGDDEPPAAATTTVTTTVTAPAPSSSPAEPTGRDDADPDSEDPPADGSFPADTSDDGGPSEPGAQPDPAGQTHVAGLRTAQHEGYSRLVIDLSSNGVPAWSVGYSEPTGPGGGPVDIQGEAFLRVVVQTAAEPGGQSQINITSSPGPIVQVRTTGFFEGQEEVLVGIRDGEQPFRAFALTDPGRIVIDVREG